MKKELTKALVWAGVMLVLALGAVFARKHGYIDGDMANRVVFVAIGLWMAWYGNRIPKTFAPSACARRAKRVSAWSMVLSGIIYTGLWAFAPISVAVWAGSGAVFASVAATLGYCLWLQSRSKTA
jgi:hypothetical protein